MSSELLADLRARDLIFQIAGEDAIDDWLSAEPRTLYCGFDPTADSLHIGSLVPLLVLRRFQQAGHRPIALVGGATGLIGDPSFKAAERQLNTPEVVAGWVEKIRGQVSQFVDFGGEHPALVVNNLDWTADFNVLDFLRDIGKHFSVNNMIGKESVRQRLDREGAGISFTEFAYMILQSFDFSELFRLHGCGLQIGGSDQWGNMVNGVELTRRCDRKEVFAMTAPLITTSDGKKMGKSEGGAMWLNADMLSPYDYWQFWRNTDDRDVKRFLNFFTEMDSDKINNICEKEKNINNLKVMLANEATKILHGEIASQKAEQTAKETFEGGGLGVDLPEIQIKSSKINKGINFLDFLSENKIMSSKSEARRVIANKGIKIDNVVVVDENKILKTNDFKEKFLKISYGKKKHYIIKII